MCHRGHDRFGMGPNIHCIIHWGPPEDIETYMQEIGRAGRDGLPVIATLYGDVKDSATHTDEKMDYCKLKPEEAFT